jgi:hypothetical protein
MEAGQKVKRCAEQIYQISRRKLQKRITAMLKRKDLRKMRITRLNLHVDSMPSAINMCDLSCSLSIEVGLSFKKLFIGCQLISYKLC